MEKIESSLFYGRTTTEIPNIVSTENSYGAQERIAKLNKNLWMYIGSIVLLLGIVGNSLTLCVLCRRRMRKLIIGIYLITLTTSDFVTSITAVLRMWMYVFFDIDYFAASAPFCKSFTFLQNFSKLCSSWMVVTITVERTLLICRPLISIAQRPFFLTPAAILMIVSIILTLVVSPELYFVKVEDEICADSKNYFNNEKNWEIFEALHYIFYSFLPSLIIIPCSCIIVIKLRNNEWGYLAHKERTSRASTLSTISVVSVSLPPSFLARMSSSTSTSSISPATSEDQSQTSAPLPLLNQLFQNLPPNETLPLRSSPLKPKFRYSNSRAYLSRHRLYRLRQNVRIVLIINVVFLVTTTPLCVLRFMLLFADTIDKSSKYVLFYASNIAALFSDMNLVIDLILFIASGKAFRNELKTLEPRRFRRKRHVQPNIIVCTINSH